MKNLFQEEQAGNSKTPGQTAMKGLFAEQKEHAAKTPNQVWFLEDIVSEIYQKC